MGKVYAQVYSLLRQEREGVLEALKTISRICYDGAEILGNNTGGLSTADFKKYLADLKLSVISAHSLNCEKDYELNRIAKNMKNKPNTQICIKCNQELPFTEEYFYKLKGQNYGLSNICRVCNGGKFRKNNIIICTECKQEFPATSEYFDKKNEGRYGLSTICKKCRSKIYYENCNQINQRLKDFRKNNPEIVRQKEKNYRKLHIEEKQLKDHRREAKIKNLEFSFTADEWKYCKKYFEYRCAYCNKKDLNLTQDHFIPVSENGSYTKLNILPVCKSCNSSKSNNDFEEWYHRQLFYSLESEEKINKYFQGLKSR
jgi:hypothetical protein